MAGDAHSRKTTWRNKHACLPLQCPYEGLFSVVPREYFHNIYFVLKTAMIPFESLRTAEQSVKHIQAEPIDDVLKPVAGILGWRLHLRLQKRCHRICLFTRAVLPQKTPLA